MEESEPRELGTLIVVVGKARNLPNKSRFGKQDPFCTVQVLEEKKRTKTIKRGGQHPEWDDELRFTIMEELEDILKVSRSESLADSTISSSTSLASVASNSSPGVTTAQALAAKSRRPLKKGGGKNMRVACYADDPKEPELIGDCYVQIDDVLKKGEVDEWYEFTYKEKYVGEIYLELTFYSNDAPPVKRNVPKPSMANYGGAGVFHEGSMSTSSSLSGRLSTSGSASGMNLYIPPYAAQHAVAPPPPPQHYGSFGNLGLPPSMSESQDFGPGPVTSSSPASFAPSVVPSATYPAVDSLARPFSTMSLGAPGTPPSSIAPSASTQNINRHSVGVSDAPWQSLLPQSQSTGSAPPSRPMSTNDALPWEQAKRLEDERRRGGATPVPRPMSGQGFATPPAGIRPGDAVPAALQAASPARHHHAHSFSYADRPVVTSLLHSTSPSPAPPLATSAPPLLPNNQYQQSPLSSFERVALALNTSQSSLNQGSVSRPQAVDDPLQTPIAAYQPTPPRVSHDYPAPSSTSAANGTPGRVNAYQQLYGQDGGSSTPAQYGSSQPHTPQHQPYPQSQPPAPYNAQDTPPAQPTPPPAQQYSTPSGNYVPWYQQTQSAQNSSGPSIPQRPNTSTPTPYAESTPPRPAFGPPPVPSRRPVPNPPGPPPPVGSGRGYYPSDELYIRSVNEVSEVYSSPSHGPQPGPSPGPSQYNLPHRPYHEDQTYHDQSYNQQTYQNPNVPQHSFSAPPLPTDRPNDGAFLDRSTTPFGEPPQHIQSGPGDPSQGYHSGQAQAVMRSTTPLPPGQPQEYHPAQIYPDPPQQPFQEYAKTASPNPQTFTPPPRHPYAQSQSVPPLPPARSPSPLPPPQRFDQVNQINGGSQAPTHLGPLPAAKSPLVNHPQTFPPSAPEPRANRQSWKDYMHSLPTYGASGSVIPGVSGATGVAPPSEPYSPGGWGGSTEGDSGAGQYGEARMPGGFGSSTLGGSPIHAKPPRPEGWRSTLPAQVNGHKWRG